MQNTTMIVPPYKSKAAAIFLGFLGPIGLLYSSLKASLIMLGALVVISLLSMLMPALVPVLLFFWWIAGVYWNAIAVERYNLHLYQSSTSASESK